MKRRTFVVIAAFIGAIFGLGFLVVPNLVLSLYGINLDIDGEFVARYFGSALLGVAFTWFTAINTKTHEEALRGGVFGGLVLSVTGLAVAIWNGIAGNANNFVWINTVIYAFLSAGFVYFYFKK